MQGKRLTEFVIIVEAASSFHKRRKVAVIDCKDGTCHVHPNAHETPKEKAEDRIVLKHLDRFSDLIVANDLAYRLGDELASGIVERGLSSDERIKSFIKRESQRASQES